MWSNKARACSDLWRMGWMKVRLGSRGSFRNPLQQPMWVDRSQNHCRWSGESEDRTAKWGKNTGTWWSAGLSMGKREESKDDALASDLRRYPSSSQGFCQLLILDSDLLILVTVALPHSLSWRMCSWLQRQKSRDGHQPLWEGSTTACSSPPGLDNL